MNKKTIENANENSTNLVLKVTKMSDGELKDYSNNLFRNLSEINKKLKSNRLTKNQLKELSSNLFITMVGIKLTSSEMVKRF